MLGGLATVTTVPNSQAQQGRLEALRRHGPVGLLRHCLTVGLQFTGPVDEQVLQAALDTVVERHEALRARFPLGEEAHVIDPDLRVRIERRLVFGTDPQERQAAARREAEEAVMTPFDVERGPLMRATLLAVGPHDHLLVFSWDQLVIDAWSATIVVRDFVEAADVLARGEPAPAAEPGCYARVRAALRRHRAREATLDRLRVERRPDSCDPNHLSRLAIWVDDEVAAAIGRRARALRIPTSTAVFGAFAAAATAWSGEDGLTITSTFAARETPDELEAVGWLANEVPISLGGPDGTVEERLRAIARRFFDALSVQRIPSLAAPAEGEDATGISVSIVYLPQVLSGAEQLDLRLGDASVRRRAVSVCPTDTDVSLYASEGGPVGEDGLPGLVLGGTVQRTRVGEEQLREILARWRAGLERLAALDWGESGWREAAAPLEAVA
ncbi:MAG TPA: condensation domain-containing protein [Gaiellaceae bacterium]|jgi:hypothetical protein|nr:condensation domain-containing protein [Gaiellaceae bacterium]